MELLYTLSPILRDSLQKIESLRQQILLTPISPKNELKIRWEATLNRIYWSLKLAQNLLTLKEMRMLLAIPSPKRLTMEKKEVVNYKKALDYIQQDWLVSPKRVTPQTILNLHEIACQPTMGKSVGALRSEGSLKNLLEYLQTGSENPVIQAGIAQIQLFKIKPFPDGNGRAARLLALLFLYKYGDDFRGLLVLEEYFRRDLMSPDQATKSALSGKNLTNWLEYFAQGVANQLEKVVQNLASPSLLTDLPTSFWEINDRQKEILALLDQPDVTITNKKAQKLFGVSQITASRDLTKLATLGLIFPIGKGRSVRYTKT